MKKLLLFLLFISINNFGQTFESYPTAVSTIFNPSNFIEFNNKMYYLARDSSFEFSIYAIDGTASGNQQIFALGFLFSSIPDRTTFNEIKIIYNGNLYWSVNNNLYKSDGTTLGTVLLKSNCSPRHFFIFNNKLFFNGSDNINGSELWSSDGTTSGTTIFKDINSGINSSFNPNLPPHFTFFNNKMFFVANDGITGFELWSTDGTAAQTALFKDIRVPTREGSAGSSNGFGAFWMDATTLGTYSKSPFKVVNGRMYFAANPRRIFQDGTFFQNDSYVLYASDGTPTGTEFVNIAFPTQNNCGTLNFNYLRTNYSQIMGFSEYNNELYITDARPNCHSFVGITNAGIYKMNNSNPLYRVGNLHIPNLGANGVSSDAKAGEMFWFNNEFYFLGVNTSASPSDGNLYLYKLNPQTETFTKLTSNVIPTGGSEFERLLLAKIVNNKLYFYKDSLGNLDICATDGTVQGTTQLARNSSQSQNLLGEQNITNGVLSFGTINNSLYFDAGINSGTKSLYRIFNQPLGSRSFDSNGIKLYPNPTTSQINLSFANNIDSANLKIVSILGQTVLEKQNLSGNNLNFDVSNFAKGMYVITVNDGGLVSNTKFVKE